MSAHLVITRPKPEEYPKDFSDYIALVPSNDLLSYFSMQTESVASIAARLSEEQLLYRYAPDKWTIKGVFAHVTDCERIYCYRALSIARGEKQPLPGFDENSYAIEAQADGRDILNIVAEYNAVRTATIELFKSFDEKTLLRTGIANGTPRSVRTLGYLAAGHELHHLGVIKERYLGTAKR